MTCKAIYGIYGQFFCTVNYDISGFSSAQNWLVVIPDAPFAAWLWALSLSLFSKYDICFHLQ
jgi:hypothetical protein